MKWKLKNTKSNKTLNEVFNNKTDAIKYAQFLVGREWKQTYIPVKEITLGDQLSDAIRLLKSNGYEVRRK